jgi:predicted lipoprotein
VRSPVTGSLLLLPALLLGCKIATIRPIESEDDARGTQQFDAEAYAASLWSEDLPAALEQAVDLVEFLPALETDPVVAGERWGRREGSGPFHVIVRGSGRVTEVDTSSRTGRARVEIETPGGPREVVVQIGPVLQGTSIRDALPTVSFDQFVNQIQFADVANALNAEVETRLLATLEPEGLVGHRVHFTGMATVGDSPLVVTPVRLETEDAR